MSIPGDYAVVGMILLPAILVGSVLFHLFLAWADDFEKDQYYDPLLSFILARIGWRKNHGTYYNDDGDEYTLGNFFILLISTAFIGFMLGLASWYAVKHWDLSIKILGLIFSLLGLGISFRTLKRHMKRSKEATDGNV